MKAPNMAAITESLQNCSLSHSVGDSSSGDGSRRSTSSDTYSDATVDLNSDISLPYHWEQCLDLKTGEIYYINWKTGMKATEDPRTMADYNGIYYSEDESSYDSESSSSDSSPASVREPYREDSVLVVAGCKGCLMYFMVPKQVEVCPKCNGQLLHFDRSENSSSSQ